MSVTTNFDSDLSQLYRDEIMCGNFDDESLVESARESFYEWVDGALVYTSDIIESWVAYGSPEPEEMSDSISASITMALFHAIIEDNEENLYDVLDEVIDNLYDEFVSTQGDFLNLERYEKLEALEEYQEASGGF